MAKEEQSTGRSGASVAIERRQGRGRWSKTTSLAASEEIRQGTARGWGSKPRWHTHNGPGRSLDEIPRGKTSVFHVFIDPSELAEFGYATWLLTKRIVSCWILFFSILRDL
jgi:hypothetical protein